MISNYGTSAIITFKKLKGSLKYSTNYNRMIEEIHSIIKDILRDFAQRNVGIEDYSTELQTKSDIRELLDFTQEALLHPIDFSYELDVFIRIHNKSVKSKEDFIMSLNMLDKFLLWYKDGTYLCTLYDLYKDYTASLDKFDLFCNSQASRDYLWWRLSFESLGRVYSELEGDRRAS